MTRKAPLIGELQRRRQTLGWSVKDLSDRCGIDENVLGDWERGIGSPPLDAAANWAAALGLRLAAMPAQEDARPGVRVAWDERRITVDGTPVRLTPMEWKALERLARTPGELVTHEALFRHLYGEDQPYRAQSTAIRVLITKLRRLLPLRIEAQWGRGYVISGIAPLSRAEPDKPDPGNTTEEAKGAEARGPAAPPGKPRREGIALVPDPPAPEAAPTRRDRPEFGRSQMRRVAAPATHPSPCRAEELGEIERFLSERGVTRCPDVATIQHAPLPTLVWDKIKRKWVRPPVPAPEREAS